VPPRSAMSTPTPPPLCCFRALCDVLPEFERLLARAVVPYATPMGKTQSGVRGPASLSNRAGADEMLVQCAVTATNPSREPQIRTATTIKQF